MKYSAFISYRRVGGAEKAELLKAVLCKKGYRAKDIFMDTYTIHTGNYVQNIEQAIAQSRNFIVIITKGCFDNLDQDGIWVHELKLAKDLGLNIIPVYFDGIRKLQPSDLPAPISELPLDNAVIYSHDYADASYERICSFMTGPRPINWLKALKKNVPSVVSVCVAIAVAILYITGKSNNYNTHEQVIDTKDNSRLESVEFSTILSKFFKEPGTNYWLGYGNFTKISGVEMNDDYLEMLSGEEEETYALPFRLSCQMYLSINGKNIHENSFGKKQPCTLNLYGPRAGVLLGEIFVGWGLGEEEHEKSPIDNYIKLLYPNYTVVKKIDKRGYDSRIYKIRDDLFYGIAFEAVGASSGEWTIYLSEDSSYIEHVMMKKSELYSPHFYE